MEKDKEEDIYTSEDGTPILIFWGKNKTYNAPFIGIRRLDWEKIFFS